MAWTTTTSTSEPPPTAQKPKGVSFRSQKGNSSYVIRCDCNHNRRSNAHQQRGSEMTKAGKGYRSIALLIVAFSIAPSLVLAQGLNGQGNIYARWWSDSVEAAGILRTGTLLPVDTRASTAPDVYPSLAGSYASSAQRPRVFITPTDMNALVTRINSSGSFSAQSFARLSTKVKAD